MTDPTGARLLDRLAAHLPRFVVFPSRAESDVLALWILHTHAVEAASATPYPHVHSPQPRCGKSTLFEVLAQLVARAESASNATAPAIFRVIEAEKPTMLLDEIDAQFKDDAEKAAAIRSILNAGYRRGPTAAVLRCEGPNHAVKRFNVFCPKAFAGISSDALHATTLDRTVPIRLERKLRSEQTERFRARRVAPEAEALYAEMAEWADANLEGLEGVEPTLPEGLDDRAQEVLEPLFAIAELAGDAWPERLTRAALELCAGEEIEDDDIGVELLADVRGAFEATMTDVLSSKSLVNALTGMEEAPWETWGSRRKDPGLNQRDLGRLLKPFGIRSKTIRLQGNDTKKGYQRQQFEEAFARYLPPEGGPETAHPSPPGPTADEDPPSATSRTGGRDGTAVEEAGPEEGSEAPSGHPDEDLSDSPGGVFTPAGLPADMQKLAQIEHPEHPIVKALTDLEIPRSPGLGARVNLIVNRIIESPEPIDVTAPEWQVLHAELKAGLEAEAPEGDPVYLWAKGAHDLLFRAYLEWRRGGGDPRRASGLVGVMAESSRATPPDTDEAPPARASIGDAHEAPRTSEASIEPAGGEG